MQDVKALDLLMSEPSAIYVMDRDYVDFVKLYALQVSGVFFVTRAKSKLNAHRLYSALTTHRTQNHRPYGVSLSEPELCCTGMRSFSTGNNKVDRLLVPIRF
jgi:hypothetical protein